MWCILLRSYLDRNPFETSSRFVSCLINVLSEKQLKKFLSDVIIPKAESLMSGERSIYTITEVFDKVNDTKSVSELTNLWISNNIATGSCILCRWWWGVWRVRLCLTLDKTRLRMWGCEVYVWIASKTFIVHISCGLLCGLYKDSYCLSLYIRY